MKLPNGFFAPLLIIIIAVLLVGGVLIYKNSSQISPASVTSDIKTQSWCHTFNTDLKEGDGVETYSDSVASDLVALHTVLAPNGDTFPNENGEDTVIFTKDLANAVQKFQEKYSDEILTPRGLSHGTGQLDALTRKKLNELYGCSSQPLKYNIDISVMPMSGPAPLFVDFNIYPAERNGFYSFEFGDGVSNKVLPQCKSSVCRLNALHTYVNPGTYNVQIYYHPVSSDSSILLGTQKVVAN